MRSVWCSLSNRLFQRCPLEPLKQTSQVLERKRELGWPTTNDENPPANDIPKADWWLSLPREKRLHWVIIDDVLLLSVEGSSVLEVVPLSQANVKEPG